MLGGALAGGAYLFFHKSVGEVQAHSPDVRKAQTALKVPAPGEPAVALVIGYDKRPHEIGNSRSDTIMLLRAQPRPKAISILSFPRDLRVLIHCPGQTPYYDKINAAYSLCRAPGTLETVRALTGVPINYIMTINFQGFRQIVDKLGGVWLDVDRRYYHSNAGLPASETYDQINIQPGYQKLDGGDALHFVRYRHTDTDFIRNARQQAFVSAMKEQISSSVSPFKLPGIIGAITHNVEVGVGGGGKLSESTVLSYAAFAYGLPPGRLFRVKIEGAEGYSYVTTDPSNITAAVRDFQNPDVEASVKAGARAGLKEKIKKQGAPPPAQTTVTLLNGNNVAGSAGLAASGLGDRGYKIVFPPNGLPANAPTFNYFRTEIYFDRSKPRARAAARKVANLFGSADVAPIPPEIRPLANGSMLVVVVGKTFHGSLAPSPLDHTPPRQPPAVIRNAGATLSMLKVRKGSVPFKLEVPTVIEQYSSPDPEKPIRRYKIEGDHKAIRLVFRMGNGIEYWGIEETDWDGAPVLSGGEQHVLQGRRFDFYWNGSHLHMVVLHENGAGYWVVNTLQDSLSNETMIAIAKGLHSLPLHKPKAKKAKKHR